MIPLRDDRERQFVPVVTWTVCALCVVIFFWDRTFSISMGTVHFADLMMRPREVWFAIRGHGDPFAIVTLFTSIFLHGSLLHLIGNMFFLVVFGSSIEDTLGSWRFALYYLGWAFAASLTQILVNTGSLTPTVGASGAIGGIMGAYLLLFPANRVQVSVPWLGFATFRPPAWTMLLLWFAYQIFIPQDGIANWAHAGGFQTGMLTILAMGGRVAVLERAQVATKLGNNPPCAENSRRVE